MDNKQQLFLMPDDAKLTLLADLIAFQSVNDHELKVAQYLQQLLQQHQIKSRLLPITPTRANLVAEIGSGQPVIGLSGHMDVVAANDRQHWQTDPFKLTEKAGKLYGRGAADMKSGLAAMVNALIELKENQLPQQGTIRLLATVGEEVGGLGSAAFAEQHYTEDLSALIIGEPSAHDIIYAHRGSMDIRLTSQGEAAHSSMPEKGFNALHPLLEVLTQAKHHFDAVTITNNSLGKPTYNATILNAGDQVNTIPDQAIAEVNIRTIPEYTNETVTALFTKLVQAQNRQGAQLHLDVYMSEMPIVKQADNSLTKIARETAQKILTIAYQPQASVGVTDASNLLKSHPEPDFPFIMFGPGDYRLAHKDNEYVEKATYLAFSTVYRELLVAYLAQKNTD